jgi:hypothetical protein
LAGVRFFERPAGRVAEIGGAEAARQAPRGGGVRQARRGSMLGLVRERRQRPGFVVAGGRSPNEVAHRLAAAERLLRVSYADVPAAAVVQLGGF